jgi:signal peptidase I
MNYYHSRGPKDGEIIMFKSEQTFYVKRVVASGGEWVEGTNGAIYLNGKILTEPYAQHTGEPQPGINDFGPIMVPAGEYFVLGDNRDFSLDSRDQQHGFVSSDSIVGKPLYVIVNFRSKRAGKAIN